MYAVLLNNRLVEYNESAEEHLDTGKYDSLPENYEIIELSYTTTEEIILHEVLGIKMITELQNIRAESNILTPYNDATLVLIVSIQRSIISVDYWGSKSNYTEEVLAPWLAYRTRLLMDLSLNSDATILSTYSDTIRTINGHHNRMQLATSSATLPA